MMKKFLCLAAAALLLSGCVTTGYGHLSDLWSRPATGAPAQMAGAPPQDQIPATPAQGQLQPPTPGLPQQQPPLTGYAGAENPANNVYTQPVEQTPAYGQAAQNGYAQQPAIQPAPAPTPGVIAAPALPSVKVGLLLPLSGPQKNLGQTLLQAAQLALFDIGYNAFELVPRDTKGTPQGAALAAQGAADAGVKLILGPVFSGEVKTAAPIAARYDINMVTFSTDWSLAGGNTYVMGFMPFSQLRRVTEYAARSGLRRIGVFSPDTDYGNAVLGAYNQISGSLGIYTVETAQFPAAASDVSAQIRALSNYDERIAGLNQSLQPLEEQLKKNPADRQVRAAIAKIKSENNIAPPPFDAILLPVGGEKAISIANTLTYFELPPQEVRRLGTGLWDDASLAAEPNLDGAWFAAPDPGARRDFEARFGHVYGHAPPRVATLAYDATALAAVLARNGYYNQGQPAFDREALTNPNGFAGVDGIFRFRPDGLVERGVAVLQFRDGQIQVLDPAPKTFQQPGQQAGAF